MKRGALLKNQRLSNAPKAVRLRHKITGSHEPMFCAKCLPPFKVANHGCYIWVSVTGSNIDSRFLFFTGMSEHITKYLKI